MFNWLTATSSPRRRAGAISVIYIGQTTEAPPTATPPSVKRVSVTVDLLPERRVASIENAWLATPEARPGDDVAVKVFLRPYRGESLERDFTLKIPAGLAKGEHKIMLSDADTINRMQ